MSKNKDYFLTAEHGARRKQESKIGAKIEEMISNDGYSAETIALGFAADRRVHLEEIVIPKLRQGEMVVCDRYYHSSLTYQPALGADFEWVKELNKFALKPDLTIILKVDAEVGMERLNDRGADGNIFEEMNFQQEVVARYQELDSKLDENIRYVDASQPIEDVYRDINQIIAENIE